MIMDAQTRNRPSLEVRTDYVHELADGLPRAAFGIHRGSMSAFSPLTAKPLPSPIQTSAPGYDVITRQHERAMVESLDARSRQGSLGGERSAARSLSPIAEQAIAAKVGYMTMDSPLCAKSPKLPCTAPSTPGNAQQAHHSTASRSIADETRSMLLSGMSASQANHVGTVANRRLSAPAEVIKKQRKQSLAVIPPDMLQAFGHVYLGDPTRADVFVAPTALRRQSGSGQADGIDGNRLAIRARIRPKSRDRKPFLLARNFDLDQLRSTIPSTPTTPSGSRRQSGASLSPEDVWNLGRTPTTPLTPLTPLTAASSERRRSSAASSGLRVGSHQPKSSSKELPVRK